MKKIFTLLLLTGILKSQAQGYQPMLADSVTHFEVAMLAIPIRSQQSTNCTYASPGNFYAKTDSVYQGLTYKRFNNGSFGGFMGLMREDTTARKVYFIQQCNTTEELLYDFSLQAGDSINYTFPNGSSSYIKDGWYKVDSIRYKHDYAGYSRRHFYLCNRLNPIISGNGPRASLEMIEGMGCTTHPLFLYASFYPGVLGAFGANARCFDTEYDELVTCKWNNGYKVYFDSCAYATAQSNPCVSHNDSCTYGTICSAVQEFNGIKSISVFPNPANDVTELEIEADRQIDLSFSMVNSLGIEVKKVTKHQLIKGKNYFKIPVKDVTPGFYLIQVSDGLKSVGRPLLINH